jgi:hypothetical protein
LIDFLNFTDTASHGQGRRKLRSHRKVLGITQSRHLRVDEIIFEEKDEPVHKYLQVLRTCGVDAKIISIQQNR